MAFQSLAQCPTGGGLTFRTCPFGFLSPTCIGGQKTLAKAFCSLTEGQTFWAWGCQGSCDPWALDSTGLVPSGSLLACLVTESRS